jgi:FAD/FMN-containing dehydrogenase
LARAGFPADLDPPHERHQLARRIYTRGCRTPQPAVSVGVGAIRMHTYNEVTTKGGWVLTVKPTWQTSYWRTNYAKLLKIKRTYDPTGLFVVRHGVSSKA